MTGGPAGGGASDGRKPEHGTRRGRGARPAMFIPSERLPPGFIERIGTGPESAAVPRPAATTVLLRDATDGIQVFLLRRNRTAGFVPGAWVFPGGRVDEADADPALWGVGSAPAEPAPAYWAAAVRELFEETGVLLARDEAGELVPDTTEPAWMEWRDALLEDRTTLRQLLDAHSLHIAPEQLVHFAHWITPVAEPRRFDTHFFVASLPAGVQATADRREMSDSQWLSPGEALDRFEAGTLPMVFPTVRTIETLAGFDTVDAAFRDLRGRAVRPVLPRLVRTAEGVTLEVDEGDEQNDG